MILVFMLPLVVHVIVMDPFSHCNDFELSKAFLFSFFFFFFFWGIRGNTKYT